MKLIDALKILALTETATQAEIKAAYKKAAMKYHPDRNPGGLEMMKLTNQAFDALKNYSPSDIVTDWDHTASFSDEYLNELNTVINSIIHLQGLEIEICGLWIWITGDTRTHKDAIKSAGCYYAPKKQAWYYRPAEYKSRGRGRYSLDEIRTLHGSKGVYRKRREEIAA